MSKTGIIQIPTLRRGRENTLHFVTCNIWISRQMGFTLLKEGEDASDKRDRCVYIKEGEDSSDKRKVTMLVTHKISL